MHTVNVSPDWGIHLFDSESDESPLEGFITLIQQTKTSSARLQSGGYHYLLNMNPLTEPSRARLGTVEEVFVF